MNDAAKQPTEDNFAYQPASHGWATSNGRYWIPTGTSPKLPPGSYTVGASQRIGVFLDRVDVVKDDLIILPDMGADVVLHEIEEFWGRKQRYLDKGVVHKRGIIMEGPPGSGKTSNSELLIEMFVKKMDGIALLVSDLGAIVEGIKLVKQREPDRPLLVVIEDIDAVARQGEEQLLNLLDGKHQHHGVVVVATTNHLERLPDRIANRPSRFDLVVKIGLPSEQAREQFLKIKEPQMDEATRKAILARTAKYSIAHLKELLILTEIFEMPLDAAAGRIDAIMERKLLPEQASLKVVKNVPFAIHDSVGAKASEAA